MQSATLIDKSGNLVAHARVADEGGYYGGMVELSDAPNRVLALFEEFEEIVNGQMFSFLDEVQDKIGSLSVRAVFDNGCEVAIDDLQVFPTTGDVSFRIADASDKGATFR